MAPAEASTYFPPLDQCLDGSAEILSWKAVYSAITDTTDTLIDGPIERHLEDRLAQEALYSAFGPSHKPTPQTRASFDDRTSAINVPPTNNGRYDIQQIKEDGLWLSTRADVDEVTALRLVVLEWQTRPASRLIQQSLQVVGRPMASGDQDHTEEFDSTKARQLRLLELLLYERQYVSKVAEILVSWAINIKHKKIQVPESKKPMQPEYRDLLNDSGIRILEHWESVAAKSGGRKQFGVVIVESLQSAVEALGRPSGLLANDIVEGLEALWAESHLAIAIHASQALLSYADSDISITRADVFLAWFRFMKLVSFFGTFNLFSETTSEALYTLQSLAALISLAMIKISAVLEAIPSMTSLVSNDTSTDGAAPYFRRIDCIQEVTTILVDSRPDSGLIASLALFGWGIVLQGVREVASTSQERKELKQSQRAIENFGTSPQSDNESDVTSLPRRRPSPLRRASTGSDTSLQSTHLEEINELIQRMEPNTDLINLMAHTAVDQLQVFSFMSRIATEFCATLDFNIDGATNIRARILMLRLLSASLSFIDYQAEILQTAVSILFGAENLDKGLIQNGEITDDPALSFIRDAVMMERVLYTAAYRFPFELFPFLLLCRAIASSSVPLKNPPNENFHLLQKSETFTALLVEREDCYKLSGDGDYIVMELTKPVDALSLVFPNLYGSHSRLLQGSTNPHTRLFLPLGTTGRAVTEDRPLVVLWNYTYSLPHFLGMILRVAFEERKNQLNPAVKSVFEAANEIIRLVTTLISTEESQVNEGSLTMVSNFLEEMSDCLDKDNDIVALIFDIFEGELYRQQTTQADENSFELLLRCLQFVHAMLAILPNRVWSFLSRSCLLGLDGGEIRLTAIIAIIDDPTGRFEFLLSGLQLFSALIRSAILLNTPTEKDSQSLTKLSCSKIIKGNEKIQTGKMKHIILQMARFTITAFESSQAWKGVRVDQMLEINIRTCDLLDQIIDICYKIDDSPDMDAKIVAGLTSGAKYIIDIFLSEKNDDITSEALLKLIHAGAETPLSSLNLKISKSWKAQTTSALNLVLRLSRVNSFLGQPFSRLEQQLLKTTPVISKLYAICESYRLPVVQLLEALAYDAGRASGQPSSLLGYQGLDATKYFLELLSKFDAPFFGPVSESIWTFLSSIVTGRQQWLAVCILKGTDPRSSLKIATKASAPTKSPTALLAFAMARLPRALKDAPREAIGILEFLTVAADYWPWVVYEVQKDEAFITACVELLKTLSDPQPGRNLTHGISHAFLFQTVAFILSVFAIQIYRANEIGGTSLAPKILPAVQYLIEKGVSPPAYNASLHSSLRKNFARKLPNCPLNTIKRTSLNKPRLGTEFYYDIDVARTLLRQQRYSSAPEEKSYVGELIRANVNLSLVEAQMNLFYSWKSFAIEMCNDNAAGTEFQKSAPIIVQSCLEANIETTQQEKVFIDLAHARADLAFALLQCLSERGWESAGSRTILPYAWSLAKSLITDAGIILSGEDAEYARTVLKILYLALQAHLRTPVSQEGQNQKEVALDASLMVATILGETVAKGFRSLVTRLHDDSSQVSPADFELLNAILRTGIHVPGVERHTEQLVRAFADEDTLRYASTLLSWSDQLTRNGDPVYGQVSLIFLLELSTIPALAESIVIEGCLPQIGTARLLSYFKRTGGIGAFEEPVRMYSIWARCMLPLAINLLTAIGAPIVGDVTTFLNLFRPQLSRASSHFDTKPSMAPQDPYAGYLSLAMASEAQSLALIWRILSAYRDAGPSAGLTSGEVSDLAWQSTAVKEDLERRLGRRNALREEIVATDEREEALSKQKPLEEGSGAESRLEERVVEELKAAVAILGDLE